MHFATYQSRLETDLSSNFATEHTHRPSLEDLIEKSFQGIDAVNEPRRQKYNAPDFIVTKGKAQIGHIETKAIDVDLNKIERSDQMKRYLKAFDNLILTDYLEFRWYVRGNHRRTVRLADLEGKNKITATLYGAQQLEALLSEFVNTRVPIKSSKELATRMAFFAKQMREVIMSAYWDEVKGLSERRPLNEQLESFKEVLIHDLTPLQFADLYAQTLCYGLFAARIKIADANRAPNSVDPSSGFFPVTASIPDDDAPLNRLNALYGLRSNPLLRNLFGHFAITDTHPDVDWALRDVENLLANAAFDDIAREFGKNKRQSDPVLHFYETFLNAYDLALKEKRGIYYTPEPVVGYIVRSVDHILKQDFKLEGLKDASKVSVTKGKRTEEVHRVQILDPAAGTGTFLHSIINHIYDSHKNNRGMWPGYVKQHLLPRLHAFELLLAPYVIAHLKIDFQLADLGYQLSNDERLNIFLTNTLEEPQTYEGSFGFMGPLLREAREASRVKQAAPVMVVLGNPPYSGHSANSGDRVMWINQLMRGKDIKTGKKVGSYFEVDGEPLNERNPKWLNDDYVKFIRFAQWRIEQTGHGVLAFVTNHGYLDNPTFRGMRQSLMQTFDDIYILDMHGNARKKEVAPDGSKDENVFDIMQGVAIGIFVRRKQGTMTPTVKHAHLWGERETAEEEAVSDKYTWLAENDASTTSWTELKPQSPLYLFTPQDTNLAKEYEKGWRVTDAMPVNSVGIVTARDRLTIHFKKSSAWRTVKDFAERPVEEAREKYNLGSDARDWKVALAQKDLKISGMTEQKLTPILYRPFDTRYTYYTGTSRGFHCMPRNEVMQHMILGKNLGLIATKQTRDKWDVLATDNPMGHKSLAAYDINNLFPLYLYPDPNKVNYEPTDAPGSRRPNLAPEFVTELTQKLGLEFIPDVKATSPKRSALKTFFITLTRSFTPPATGNVTPTFSSKTFPECR